MNQTSPQKSTQIDDMTSVYSSYDARSHQSQRRTLVSTKNIRRTTVGITRSKHKQADLDNLYGKSIERLEMEKNALQKLKDMESSWSQFNNDENIQKMFKMSEGFDKIKKLKVEKDNNQRNKLIINPKLNFTVTEESEERMNNHSTKKIIEMKVLDTKPSKDIKKLEIILDEQQSYQVPDPIRQKRSQLNDVIKIREVLRTVDSKSKEMMNQSFYLLKSQKNGAPSIESQINTKDQSMNSSTHWNPSTMTNQRRYSNIRPIKGQKVKVSMKSGSEITSLKIKYIKQKDQLYNQYLVQQQINQKEQSLARLMNQIEVLHNKDLGMIAKGPFSDCMSSVIQIQDQKSSAFAKYTDKQDYGDQYNRGQTGVATNENALPPLKRNHSPNLINMDFPLSLNSQKNEKPKLVLFSRYAQQDHVGNKVSKTPKQLNSRKIESNLHSNQRETSQLRNQIAKKQYHSKQPSMRKDANLSTIQNEGSSPLQKQLKFRVGRNDQELKSYIEQEKSMLMSGQQSVSPDRMDEQLKLLKNDIKFNDCNKLDNFINKYNQFKFMDAVNGFQRRKELVFRTEREKIGRVRLLSDSDLKLLLKRKEQ
ncbi:UNKNOWN [Stylonychia lemnae]|uniref:Uncharacterized protein n=1 Tax=Stylonychia lemnae TaxID=5949 RepID=A0A078B0Q6_STYLE|nr:UNKNOWN [Stylonychia lemnae]|eukprot:CDW86698.1 UNKNOWN [Stylonychia lemnae]